MEPKRFDGFVRALGRPASRRSTLGAFAGTLAALGLGGSVDALAKPRPATHHHDAGSAHRKRKHRKQCNAGSTSCPTMHHKHVCVDLETDAAHCGQCRRACGSGQSCQGGTCVDGCTPPCDSGKVCRQGACVCPNSTTDCGGTCQQCCSPADCPSAPCSDATCTNGTCGLRPIAGCCQTNGDCDDQNPCTIDTCDGNSCRHDPASSGATCGTNQVCCETTCYGSGQVCQNGNCAAPCTPDCQGKICGSDGCGGSCGTCPSGMFCSNGQCAGCSRDSDCTSGGACKLGACIIDPRTFRGRCQYSQIPGCCVSNSDCSLAPCDVSVSCVNSQCVHNSACFGCNTCDPNTNGCTRYICPECQYCGAGGVCKADRSKDSQSCSTGYCFNGTCGCIPDGEPCGDGCCGCCGTYCILNARGAYCSSTPPI